MPDQSLPYVIHHPCKEKETGSQTPFVCISPKVIHMSDQNQEQDVLYYITNREHVCIGKLLETSETGILFENTDGHFSILFGGSGNVAVNIAVMSDSEFEIVKRKYEENRWGTLQTKEDLVNSYMKCLDD